MTPEEINFQTFFAAKLKDRGVSIKKLAEATGIAPTHLEALAHGRFEDLPSAPYVRGYLARLGQVLGFNGEEWWEKMKSEHVVQNSGSSDALPNNRFLRRSPAKFVWLGGVALLVIIYLIFQVPAIFRGPQLAITMPSQSVFTTTSSAFTIEGTVKGASSLMLGNAIGGGSTGENISIASDGSWQKSVLLQDGPNTFQVVAKKLLGGETTLTEQIIYVGGAGSGLAPTTTAASSSATSSATGTGASSTGGL